MTVKDDQSVPPCDCPPSHRHRGEGACPFVQKPRAKDGFGGSKCLCFRGPRRNDAGLPLMADGYTVDAARMLAESTPVEITKTGRVRPAKRRSK